MSLATSLRKPRILLQDNARATRSPAIGIRALGSIVESMFDSFLLQDFYDLIVSFLYGVGLFLMPSRCTTSKHPIL